MRSVVALSLLSVLTAASAALSCKNEPPSRHKATSMRAGAKGEAADVVVAGQAKTGDSLTGGKGGKASGGTESEDAEGLGEGGETEGYVDLDPDTDPAGKTGMSGKSGKDMPPPAPDPGGKNPGQNPGQNDPGQTPGKPTDPGNPDPGPDTPDSPTTDPTPDGKVAIGAHLINQIHGTCRRLVILGDASSTENASGPNCKSDGELMVRHDWYAARGFDMPHERVKGTLTKNHRGSPLPRDVSNDGIADFPTLDVAILRAKVSGTVRTGGVSFSSWHPDASPAENIVAKATRNVVLVGTRLDPILINGDVLIEGDLVIKGYYRGAGTLYVTGNIFVPHDLRAVETAFPYSDHKATASGQAKSRVASATDALGLFAGGFVFAGDNYPLYGDPALNPHVQAMYAWFSGGKRGYKRLHEPVWNCQANSQPVYTKALYDQCDCHIQGGFSLIEANVYARHGFHGSSGSWPNAETYLPNSYAVHGLVITPRLDVVTTPDLCTNPTALHPVHQRPQGWSYLEIDYRLQHGVRSLSLLKPLYKP